MTLLRNKSLLIFDCDGVLFDSHEANIAYFDQCLKSAHYPPLQKEQHGKVKYMSVHQLLMEITGDGIEADRVLKISHETDYRPFIPMLLPMFDFDEVLLQLKGQYDLAVATNRGKSFETLFSHFNLERYFSYSISTLEAAPKPDPDMILKCLDHFGSKKSEAIYIGDAMSDYLAATNAGIDYIWVGNDKEEPNIASVRDLLGPALLL